MVWAGRKVPTGDAPGFNAEDPYADPVALLEHREYVVWEKEVKIEEAKVSLICSAPAGSSPVASVSPQSILQILREKLKDCYLREGVNHYQNCRQVQQLSVGARPPASPSLRRGYPLLAAQLPSIRVGEQR